jgi:hypothetical protein
MRKWLKRGTLAVIGAVLVGGFLFGTDFFSYVKTSAGTVRESVRENVPIEFELERARDLINEILPEIHSNIHVIAQDEVEIAALQEDIQQSTEQLGDERKGLARLRNKLNVVNASYSVSGRNYSRAQLMEFVSQRFSRVKDAEVILGSKQRLLNTRETSLQAAMQLLERARHKKAELEQKVEGLIAQNRLLKASAVQSKVHVDHSKLSRADQLLSDIQKRLDVAERVLAHEESTVLFIEPSMIDETSLLAEIDAHLADDDDSSDVAVAANDE